MNPIAIARLRILPVIERHGKEDGTLSWTKQPGTPHARLMTRPAASASRVPVPLTPGTNHDRAPRPNKEHWSGRDGAVRRLSGRVRSLRKSTL